MRTRNRLTSGSRPSWYDFWSGLGGGRRRPRVVSVSWPDTVVFGRERVMKMGDNGDVPRIARQGARQEAACVVNEVGGDDFHKLLRELSDCRRALGGCLWGASIEQPLDLGFGSIPKPVDKEFVCYRSVKRQHNNVVKLDAEAPVNEDVGVFNTIVVLHGSGAHDRSTFRVEWGLGAPSTLNRNADSPW